MGKRFDEKANFNFKILTSQPGKYIITIHILPIISRTKAKQILNLDQLIAFDVGSIFIKSYAENGAGWLVPYLFFEVKVSGLYISFKIYWQSLTWTYNKNKLH